MMCTIVKITGLDKMITTCDACGHNHKISFGKERTDNFKANKGII